MENKIEIRMESVLVVRINGEPVAINAHEMGKRAHLFYACDKMGVEEIKHLLEDISGGKPLMP